MTAIGEAAIHASEIGTIGLALRLLKKFHKLAWHSLFMLTYVRLFPLSRTAVRGAMQRRCRG